MVIDLHDERVRRDLAGVPRRQPDETPIRVVTVELVDWTCPACGTWWMTSWTGCPSCGEVSDG